MVTSKHADVPVAATVTSAFLQSGQVCTSTERVYVEHAVHDEFVDALVKRAQQLRVGHGLEVAEIDPLVSEAAQTRVLQWIQNARDAGATIALCGGVPTDQNTGWFVEPIIVTEITQDMGLFEDEIFGPIVSILRVNSFDEALEQANQSAFGLGAAVFTRDLGGAHKAIATLEAGMVWVNNPLVDNDALPFGGMKKSGLGRALGRSGLDTFCQPRMVILDPVAKEAEVSLSRRLVPECRRTQTRLIAFWQDRGTKPELGTDSAVSARPTAPQSRQSRCGFGQKYSA